MRKIILKSAALFTATLFVMSACKKNDSESTTPTTTDSTQQVTQVSDQSNVQDETELATLDVQNAVSATAAAGARIDRFPCNATIDSSNATGKWNYTLTFNGENCDGNRSRSGQISFSIYPSGSKWIDKGTSLIITYNNYKVTRNSTGKSLTFNGADTLTNVSGGLLISVLNGTTITRLHTGTMTITFDNGAQRKWSSYRMKTYSNNNGVIQLAVAGNPANGGTVVSGTNRFGSAFSTAITSPIVVNSQCGFDQPVSGVEVFTGALRQTTLTYGVDANGNPVTSGCPYGYKADWVNAQGKSRELIVQYQ